MFNPGEQQSAFAISRNAAAEKRQLDENEAQSARANRWKLEEQIGFLRTGELVKKIDGEWVKSNGEKAIGIFTVPVYTGVPAFLVGRKRRTKNWFLYRGPFIRITPCEYREGGPPTVIDIDNLSEIYPEWDNAIIKPSDSDEGGKVFDLNMVELERLQ